MPPKAKSKAKTAGRQKAVCTCGAGPIKGPHHMEGCGFFSKVWDKVKNAAKWVKDKKVISSLLKIVPHPAGQVAGILTGAAGLGTKRKRKAKPKAGGSFASTTKWLKDNRAISKTLRAFPHPTAHRLATAVHVVGGSRGAAVMPISAPPSMSFGAPVPYMR